MKRRVVLLEIEMNSLAVAIFLQYVSSTSVLACVRSSTNPSTSTSDSCLNPSQSSGVIVDVPSNEINSQNPAIGTCPCSNGLTQNFYTSQQADPAMDTADLDVQCVDMTQFCACDAAGNCFQPTSNAVTDVQLFSFCDSVCQIYALIIADADTDGLTDGTTTFTSGQQFNGGTQRPFSSSSNDYFKPTSVSCNSCMNIRGSTCTGPFSAS